MIDFPKQLEPNSMVIGLSSNTAIFESTLNKSMTTSKFAGDAFEISMSFDSLDTGGNGTIDEAAILSAFLFKLGGRSGKAKIPMFNKKGKVVQGNPVVNGAGQSGGLLVTNGWLLNRMVLKQGDYITINDELKFISDDVITDSLGNATLNILPWLRHEPTTGDEIITNRPYGVFRLKEDDVSLNYEPMNATATIDMREVIYV